MCKINKDTKKDILKSLDLTGLSIGDIAHLYAEHKEILEVIESKMNQLKKLLIENKVNEYFPEEDLKVVYQEGSQKSYLDAKKVCGVIGINKFLEIAKVSETDVKTLEDSHRIIGESKVVTEERTSPSVRVAKLSKEDKERLGV
jgi:hypothetical protein